MFWQRSDKTLVKTNENSSAMEIIVLLIHASTPVAFLYVSAICLSNLSMLKSNHIKSNQITSK